MQLVAYGAQDIYLTGNPQITFFKVVYRRHTNFSMEAIQQTLNGTVGFNSKVTATISRNGDLVHRMYVEWGITHAGNDDHCANLGSALFKEVEVEIGGQKIDKHYGHWLETYAQLTEQNDGVVGQLTGDGSILKNGTKFHHMSCMGGVEGNSNSGTTIGTFFTPFQFWFCRNPGLALPLIALQYHEVKLSITTENDGPLVSDEGADDDSSSLSTFNLWVDYIYLDTDERRRFAQVSHEYLIEQLQFESHSDGASMNLNFNHPVKELIWAKPQPTLAHANVTTTGPSTPIAMNADLTYQLKLNGHDRFATQKLNYFTKVQVWQHHTGFGGLLPDRSKSIGTDGAAQNSIAVYSFALKPEEHQPSGTCNFSRIDNAQLNSTGTSSALWIYAVNYNVLRIMSGMGGLAYSN